MKQAEETPEGLGLSGTASGEVAKGADDGPLVAAMHEYVAALEAGQELDRGAFLACRPEIAAELADCLDALEFVHGIGPQSKATPSQGRQQRPPAAASSELAPEGPLGDYRIVRQVGQGGMGVVYEAVQISLGRRVALKILPFAAALDARQRQRFQNESHAAAQLHHTNIVPVYGVGCERGIHYYAMQFIEGQTLAQVIADLQASVCRGPSSVAKQDHSGAEQAVATDYGPRTTDNPTVAALSTQRSARNPAFFRTIADLGLQAAEALEHAHQFGVIHRDIKPANLLIENAPLPADGAPLATQRSPLRLWITDFGLAHCHGNPGLTLTGDLIGTLRYMSPEQALAKRVLVDQRTDIYSLGATLYELLTLEPAFAGADKQEVLRQIAFEEPRPPRRWNPAIPAELETIVLKALEKNPAERYPTAQEMADDLRRFLEDKPVHARRPTLLFRARKWSRRHRSVVTATIVSTFLALTIGLLLTIWQWRLVEERRDQAEKAELAAKRAEREAKKAAAKLKAINDFLIEDLLHQASPGNNPVDAKISVRELLDRASAKIGGNKRFADEPEVEATLRRAIGETYYSLGLFGEAEKHVRLALDIHRRFQVRSMPTRATRV